MPRVHKKKIIAMLLAGGQGSRLGVLTKSVAKPAVPFGGKYKIIDFPLSNCVNSGIDTIGVLTQYQPLELNAYIGNGQPWDLDRQYGGVTILPPYVKGEQGEWYKGTANAIYQNMHYIDLYQPEYVLILSGDHVYKMNYALMLKYHEMKQADCTIAVINVPLEEASRFGVMNADEDLRIYEFEEKPHVPKSTLASMGVYIFTWSKLKEYLIKDEIDDDSSKDFGKNIIPSMLEAGEKMYAYEFKGYWKDVGTVESLWQANMDLLNPNVNIEINDPPWRIYSKNPILPPQFVKDEAILKNAFISEGCTIDGEIENSIIFPDVEVGQNAVIRNSVVMSGTKIDAYSHIEYSIIAEDVHIESNTLIGYADEETENGNEPRKPITVIGKDAVIKRGTRIDAGQTIKGDI